MSTDIIEDKRAAFKVFISTAKQEDEIIYKMKRAIAKRGVRKRHRERWNKFINE
jgi:hypothetical protein